MQKEKAHFQTEAARIKRLQEVDKHTVEDVEYDYSVPSLRSSIGLEFFNEMKENFEKKPPARRYGENTYKLCFILKNWYSPYEILRKFIPLPSHQSIFFKYKQYFRIHD